MNYVRILVLASVLTGLGACAPKGATTTAAADTSPTLATVNGTAAQLLVKLMRVRNAHDWWRLPGNQEDDAA